MKNTQKALALVSMLIVGSIAYGYNYDFTNTLKGPVHLRVKMKGINEPWYYGTIQGQNSLTHTNYTFAFQVNSQLALNAESTQREYVGRKVFFCLDPEMEIAPFVLQGGQWVPTTNWIKVKAALLPVESFNQVIAAASGFGGGILATAAANLAKLGATAAGAGGAASTIGTVVGAVAEKPLSMLVAAIGDMVGSTYCKDRSFKIVPDFDAKGNEVPNSYVIVGLAR